MEPSSFGGRKKLYRKKRIFIRETDLQQNHLSSLAQKLSESLASGDLGLLKEILVEVRVAGGGQAWLGFIDGEDRLLLRKRCPKCKNLFFATTSYGEWVCPFCENILTDSPVDTLPRPNRHPDSKIPSINWTTPEYTTLEQERRKGLHGNVNE